MNRIIVKIGLACLIIIIALLAGCQAKKPTEMPANNQPVVQSNADEVQQNQPAAQPNADEGQQTQPVVQQKKAISDDEKESKTPDIITEQFLNKLVPKGFKVSKFLSKDMDGDNIPEAAVVFEKETNSDIESIIEILNWDDKLSKYKQVYTKTKYEWIEEIKCEDIVYGGAKEFIFIFNYLPHYQNLIIISKDKGFKEVLDENAYWFKIEDVDSDGKMEWGEAHITNRPEDYDLDFDELKHNWNKWDGKEFKEIKEEYKTLDECVKDLCPKGLKLTQTLKSDIDKDGNEEIILSFGDKAPEECQIFYVLRKINNKYVKLSTGDNILNGGSVSLGNLHGDGTKQILRSIIPADRDSIYEIYEFENDNLNKLSFSSNEDEDPDVMVEDLDNDGIDEIFFDIRYHDVQKHNICRVKKWNGKKYKDYKVDVYYSNEAGFVYPQKPEDVVMNYVEDYLNNINLRSPVLEREIVQLRTDERVSLFKLENYFDISSLYYGTIELENRIILKLNNSVIICLKKAGNKQEVYFTLTLKDNKWKIKDISEKKPHIE